MLKISIYGEFRDKIEVLSTDNLLRRKFAAVCRKIATSCSAQTFLSHDAADSDKLQ